MPCLRPRLLVLPDLRQNGGAYGHYGARHGRRAQDGVELAPPVRAALMRPSIDPRRLRMLDREHLDLPFPDRLPFVLLVDGY